MKSKQTSSQELENNIEEQNQAPNSNKNKLFRWILSLLILGGGIALWQFFPPRTSTIESSRQ